MVVPVNDKEALLDVNQHHPLHIFFHEFYFQFNLFGLPALSRFWGWRWAVRIVESFLLQLHRMNHCWNYVVKSLLKGFRKNNED